ncbi:MAG: ABC transporter ATP-binding protein [Sulfurovaceae bacterium]|nr:ABC transporter ATP-binding protein [Sulfurovaceae bacterium]
MKDKIKKLRSQLPYLPKTIKLIWQASRWWSAAWAALLLLGGILPVAVIYLVKPIIDNVSMLEGKGMDGIDALIIPIAILGIVVFLLPISVSLLNLVRSIQAEKIQDSVKAQIHSKAISLPLSFFETPRYHDMLYRANVDALSRPAALLENVGLFVQNLITLAGLLMIMSPLAWWLPLVLIAAAIPALVIALRFTLKFHTWRTKNTAGERRLRYFDYVMTDSEHASEMRLFDLGKFFTKLYWSQRVQIRSGYFSLLRSEFLVESLSLLIGFLVLAFVMGWALYETLMGNVSIGFLSMFYIAFTQAQRIMRSILGNASELYKNILFLENLFEFLAIKVPDIGYKDRLPSGMSYDIVFDEVSFRYPHSDKIALDNLSLTLEAGKITAIVGTNGAGKSTLVKLLCRFYDPDSGEIRINGTPLSHVDPKELHDNMTVLFQNYVHYHMSVKENIALKKTKDDNKIIIASKAAGSHDFIKKLDHGYDNMLGRWFGGAELSGGEWQRIALSRAFMRDAGLIILDEPTSALDSWAEIDWLGRFRTLCLKKTALIITHRFTTARHADMIYVMDNGRVIESGNHDELLRLNGSYASSWREQTKEFI